jgi:hypothetical protein
MNVISLSILLFAAGQAPESACVSEIVQRVSHPAVCRNHTPDVFHRQRCRSPACALKPQQIARPCANTKPRQMLQASMFCMSMAPLPQSKSKSHVAASIRTEKAHDCKQKLLWHCAERQTPVHIFPHCEMCPDGCPAGWGTFVPLSLTSSCPSLGQGP